MMLRKLFRVLLTIACAIACWGVAAVAPAVDFESFEFNDSNGTALANTVNTANPGNAWFEDPQMTPSQTQQSLGGRPGSYYIIKSASSSDNNFLQIDDINSGVRYLTAKISGWNFQETSNEQFRLGFLNSDTEPNFGNLITAQMSLVRVASGEVELTGGALGVGATAVVSDVTFASERTTPFEMTLALDKTANTYKVFYRDGTAPTQVLGSGLVDPTRDGKAIRMQASGVFGDFAQFFPSEVLDFLAVDRIALTDVNPHTDLITLEIDRINGAMTLRNTSGAAINGIESYSITSVAGGLNPENWTPIAGGSNTSSNAELTQSFAGGINLTNGQVIALSNASGAWLKSPLEDVSMVLNLTGGLTRTVNVNYIDNGGLRFATGDLNFDNVITVADYLILAGEAEKDLLGLSTAEAYRQGDLNGDGFNSIADFAQFKAIFELNNGGAGSFSRMLAGIPEPSGLALLGIAAICVSCGGHRWRTIVNRLQCSNHLFEAKALPVAIVTLGGRFCVALAILAMAASVSRAAILEDFMFNDANGTVLSDADNSANPGNGWVLTSSGSGDLDNSAVLNGSFRLQKTTTNLSSSFLDVDNITSGKAWLVAEMSGWSFTPTASSPTEEVRFTFIDNDGPTFGSSITAQMRIVRAGDALSLVGTGALGTGATNVAGSFALPLVRSTPFTMVLELDKDLDQYSVFYKDDTNPFQALGGAANLGASTLNDGARDGNSIRFGPTGTFNDTGEFFDINRIYLTDTNPLGGPVDPVTLSLEVRSNGQVFIKNETADPISFDFYRIASASNSLNFAGWNSLANQGVDPFLGGDDPGELWAVSGGSNDAVLAESFLLSASTLDPGEEFSLGAAFKVEGIQDLTFQYRDSVSLAQPSVAPTYVTVAGVEGDFNNNGVVDAADYTIWRDKLGTSFQLQNEGGITPGTVDAADFAFWKSRFGATSVAGAGSLASVPEPGALVLIVAIGLLIVPGRWR